jgi:pimeloyl-ACP methyl ester carboxylesterase
MRQVGAGLEAIRAGLRAREDGAPVAQQPAAPGEPLGPALGLATPASGLQQQIRFCTTPDQVRLAYATMGAGPVIVKAGNPLTHLEYDLHSPVWRHWWQGLARDHTLVRYDERGCGLSDWRVPDQSMGAWTRDLETVVDQLGPEPFVLLGCSQGAAVAIAYAVRHPERVSHLILYGGYIRGRHRRAQTPEQHDEAHTLVEVMRLGWGKNNPAFRQVFATLFMPDATIEQMRWYTELARVTTSPENAAEMEMAFHEIDVADLAAQVTTPTLVLHARGDAMCPFEEGRQTAALIPGARLVPLDSNNHILLEDEPAWTQFLAEVRHFITPAGKVAAEPPTHTTPAQAESPRPPAAREQHIRFCQAADGVRLAYATVGDGPALVKTANWLSHLEYDWISPIWRHWMLGLAETHTLIRYDERACGLSDWEVNDISFEAWVRDLETVVEASAVDRFALLGISQGGPIAIAYALRHPERVSHLVLYGTYVRGRLGRKLTAQQIQEYEALISLVRSGWGQENPAFRQVFTSYFIPGGTFEQFHWFNDMQRVSASPENAARMIEEFGKIDVRSLAPQLKLPTLVLHAVNDARIPFAEGRLTAALIPGARFVPLDSRNHILLESEPAWQRFLSEVRQFLGTPEA